MLYKDLLTNLLPIVNVLSQRALTEIFFLTNVFNYLSTCFKYIQKVFFTSMNIYILHNYFNIL